MPPITSRLEIRLACEYGSMFITSATPPPCIVFADERQVTEFQSSLDFSRQTLGEYAIELQDAAMQALLAARDKASRGGARITARAASASLTDQTVGYV